MKGTSPSRASRGIAATGNEVPRWEVRSLINSFGRGSPWLLSPSGSIWQRASLPSMVWIATGKPALVRPSVARGKLLEMVAALPPCVIGMEACSGAHHWARLFAAHGHTVRLVAPKFVVPYRLSGKRGKNDAADAAAVCEAVMIGRGHEFKCGRQLSAWLGLVPVQYSSGGKQRLGRITKAGDPYLRMLLILGARAVLRQRRTRPMRSADGPCSWPRAWATGKQSSRSRPRMRACPGPCWPRARASSCRPEYRQQFHRVMCKR